MKWNRERTRRTVAAGAKILAAALLAFAVAGCRTSPAGPMIDPTPTDRAIASDADRQADLRRDAVSYLIDMTQDDYAGYRANAIEALQPVPEAGEPAAREGLLDENLGVRFVAAMAIGQQQYGSSAALVHELLQDEDDSVRAAAIYALRRNGYQINVSALASMLKSPELRTRSNAAMILGELGDPSAIPLLREALEYDLPSAPIPRLRVAQLQMAEALIKLGDETGLTRVRAHLFADDPAEGETRALAAQIIGRVEDRRSRDYLVTLVARWREHQASAEVRLAAMEALARMDDPPPVEYVAEYLGPTYEAAPTTVRAQAVYTLGVIGDPETWPWLAMAFRESREPLVRLQAAAALVRVLPDPGSGE